MKVAINGWGRIGRIVFRVALQDKSNIDFVAANDLTELSSRAHLLKYDSVHGVLKEDVKVENDTVVVNGKRLKALAERDLEKLPWGDLGVDVVVESTGVFTDRKNAMKHIAAGCKKVIITAPAKDPDVTLAPGVNDEMYDQDSHKIISLASCTTNCLAPIAKVLNDEFGISRGFMTTIHSYTNDQRLLDGLHSDLRRSRAAAISIIPTTTGAASAIGLVLPSLAGKMNGIALRVPTINVSVVDLVAELRAEVTREEVNNALEEASKTSLSGILAVSHEPLVSIDYVGSSFSSIVDAEYTDVIGDKSKGKGNLVKVLAWYDNEWGYSRRVVDMLERIAEHELK